MVTSNLNNNDGPKPIGRRLSLLKSVKRKGIPPSTVAFIVIITALIAFTAGTRLDDYVLLDSALKKNSNNEVLPDDLDYSSVERVYDTLKIFYDGTLTIEGILDGLKQGLADSTKDPYTTYLNVEQAKNFRDDLNGTFSGIGAEIGKEDEFIIVVAPLVGFPAEVAGIKSQDVIFEIDGQTAIGLSIEEAVLLIRGEEGTEVKLTILRDGEKLDFAVTRASITIPSVASEITSENIGVLRISRFAEDTSKLAKTSAQEFVSAGVKAVILDLRNNSGGFLSSAVDVSGLWLDNVLVTQQREDDGRKTTETLTSSRGSVLGDLPTVVLINEGSASASEIVAGAFQDYETASILGVTSFGKGSVQDLKDLPDGGVLKVTVARWFTPNGNNIDQTGIIPNIEVEFIDAEDGSDNQLLAAIDLLNK